MGGTGSMDEPKDNGHNAPFPGGDIPESVLLFLCLTQGSRFSPCFLDSGSPPGAGRDRAEELGPDW